MVQLAGPVRVAEGTQAKAFPENISLANVPLGRSEVGVTGARLNLQSVISAHR